MTWNSGRCALCNQSKGKLVKPHLATKVPEQGVVPSVMKKVYELLQHNFNKDDLGIVPSCKRGIENTSLEEFNSLKPAYHKLCLQNLSNKLSKLIGTSTASHELISIPLTENVTNESDSSIDVSDTSAIDVSDSSEVNFCSPPRKTK